MLTEEETKVPSSETYEEHRPVNKKSVEVNEKETKKQLKAYARYSTLGIQMAVIIGGCVWLGTFLDGKYNPGGNGWTIGLSLFGVAAALYQVMSGVIRISKEKDKEKERES